MKNKIKLLGALTATIPFAAITISCSSNEIKKINLNFQLSEENLGLEDATKWPHHRAPKNYPYTLVQQNTILSYSNDFYDSKGKTYREALEQAKGLTSLVIKDNQVYDIFGLGSLIHDSSSLMLNGMGMGPAVPLTKESWDKTIQGLNSMYAMMKSDFKMGVDTYFKTSFGSDKVFGTTSDEYWNYLNSHKDEIDWKTRANRMDAIQYVEIKAFEPNKHIHLYNNGKRIGLDDKITSPKITLTIKIEE